jgi:glycosyltransferase involved in cell wall biosynthesis
MNRISIITVNFNSGHKLFSTSKSLVGLERVEWIVIDGQSSDLGFDQLDDLPRRPDIFISEKDEGIYDAMNKGLIYSNCPVLFYLNSGDEIIDHLAFALALENSDIDAWSISPIVSRGVNSESRTRRVRHSSYLRALLGVRPLPHQGALIGRNLLNEVSGFRLQDGLAADQTMMLRCWKVRPPVILENPFTLFLLDGVGSKQVPGSFAWQMHNFRSENKSKFYGILSKTLALFLDILITLKVKDRG